MDTKALIEEVVDQVFHEAVVDGIYGFYRNVDSIVALNESVTELGGLESYVSALVESADVADLEDVPEEQIDALLDELEGELEEA